MNKVILVFLLLSPTLRAEDNYSKETVKSENITPSLFSLQGAGGNMTALIGADGVLLVDDDFAPMSEKLLAKLKELGGASPRFVINTHFHYDHTGGNEALSKSATIIAASEVRERLMKEQVLWRRTHAPVPEKGLPNLTYENSITLYLNEEEVKVFHLPHGHTDGDTVVFFKKAKVLSAGDLYFSGMYPIFHPEHQGSLKGLIQNLEFVLKETPPGAKVVPGHGPLSDRTELAKYLAMIKASAATVKQGIRQGLSLKKIQAKGLDPQWEQYSHGYRSTDQWIESIYFDLVGHT